MNLLLKRQLPAIDWRGVPYKYVGKVSAVCRSLSDCQDLSKWYGDPEFCPIASVLLLIPGHPTLLVGAGYATAAELRDDSVELWGKYSDRLAKTGALVDFDVLREKARLPRREDVGALTQEAFHERIKKHRQNPVTDPAREPQYVRLNGRTVHPVSKIGETT